MRYRSGNVTCIYVHVHTYLLSIFNAPLDPAGQARASSNSNWRPSTGRILIPDWKTGDPIPSHPILSYPVLN